MFSIEFRCVRRQYKVFFRCLDHSPCHYTTRGSDGKSGGGWVSISVDLHFGEEEIRKCKILSKISVFGKFNLMGMI